MSSLREYMANIAPNAYSVPDPIAQNRGNASTSREGVMPKIPRGIFCSRTWKPRSRAIVMT